MAEIEKEWAGEYTEDDVSSWRDGDWIIVKLADRVILRRLTRDTRFITARVNFSSNRSPRYARKDRYLIGAEVRTQRGVAGGDHYKNFIDVPIVGAQAYKEKN